jgi:hypothetical protein
VVRTHLPTAKSIRYWAQTERCKQGAQGCSSGFWSKLNPRTRAKGWYRWIAPLKRFRTRLKLCHLAENWARNKRGKKVSFCLLFFMKIDGVSLHLQTAVISRFLILRKYMRNLKNSVLLIVLKSSLTSHSFMNAARLHTVSGDHEYYGRLKPIDGPSLRQRWTPYTCIVCPHLRV